MPIRGAASPRTLEFHKAADFLEKFNREIARLTEANHTTDVIDHATNAAMTAWHLTDWAWHDIEKDKTAGPFQLMAKIAGKPVRSLADLQAFARETSLDVRYCESIAVSSKHFGSSGPEFSSAVQSRTEETRDPGKATALSFTVSELSTEIRNIRTVAELVLVEEMQRRPVLEILTGARDWWSELFSKIGLT
jgi:hypothetical protein